MKRLLKISIFLLSLLILTGCTKEEVQDEAMQTYSYEQDLETYELENDRLKFTLNPDTTYFEVVDKQNNYTWTSNPVDGANDPNADSESKKYLQSTLLIEYSNDTGMNTIFNNYEYSISKQIYSIEEGEDYIKVNYTIGNVEQVFIMPIAVPESRMNIFKDNMDSKQQRQINDYYRKIDITKLRPTDNKSELLSMYPDLETEPVYELREGVADYLKKKIETIFTEAGYSYEDYQEDLAHYAAENTKETPYFNVSIRYRLEGNDLVVELPFEDMQWRNSYPLTKIEVLPYLGAGNTQEDGFILVPDGNGGIINFNNGKNEQSSYYTEVYGWDSAIKRDAVIDESRSAFPVFGIAKEGVSMIGIVEDHSAVASIMADVSGRTHSYNYVNASYVTFHSASVQVSAKTDKSVMVYEAEKPEGVLKQRYRFLGTDTYSEMAQSYRDYLLERYPGLTRKEDSSTPVNVTIVGAIDEVKQRFGLPVSMPVSLTSYEEARTLLKDLNEAGYSNLSIKYSGWMNGGIKQTIPKKINTISQLGSKKELKEFMNYGKEIDVPIYLEGMVMHAFDDGLFDGFSVNQDAAKFTSREIVELYDFSQIYYGIEDWNDSYYLLKPQLTIKYMKNISEYAKASFAYGVAFSDIGYLLSADFNPKNLTTRYEAMLMQKAELERIASNGMGIAVNGGNEYVLPYVDFITDMDLKGKQYQIIDHSVPFYSIAIHGLVNYAGAALNLAGAYQTEILRSAEAGAGLSFTFTKEPTSILQNSNYTHYFATDYEKWKDEAYAIYKRYEAELGHCFDQYIINHERLQNGVFATTYEDGTKVYVNYNNVDYVNGDLNVPAHDYIVEGR
ncbi:MAG: hypothetical protein E7255_14360 [Lachnospiraceae bacterium]|nr:hypothetical protein [Lachnospiraceae bacterium]